MQEQVEARTSGLLEEQRQQLLLEQTEQNV
jgi:hypothetical protein